MARNDTDSNLAAKVRQALWLASQGMHVFPLIPGRRIPVGGCDRCRTGSPEYMPHTADECACTETHCHGSHAATTDPHKIVRWWSGRNQLAGIGIHLGRSGLVMLDIDAHQGRPASDDVVLPGVKRTVSAGLDAQNGWDSMAMLAAERNELEPWNDRAALRVFTPSGGLHIWYRAADADRYRSVDGKLAWQVDVKAGAAFAVAPGTEVYGKGWYQPAKGSAWGDGPTGIPAWLDREIRRVGGYVKDGPRESLRARLRASHGRGDRQIQPPSDSLVEAVVAEAVEMVASAPGGQRNAALNAAAFKVGRALLSRDETLRESLASALEAAAVAGGTPASEARATVASGLAGGVRAALK